MPMINTNDKKKRASSQFCIDPNKVSIKVFTWLRTVQWQFFLRKNMFDNIKSQILWVHFLKLFITLYKFLLIFHYKMLIVFWPKKIGRKFWSIFWPNFENFDRIWHVTEAHKFLTEFLKILTDNRSKKIMSDFVTDRSQSVKVLWPIGHKPWQNFLAPVICPGFPHAPSFFSSP